MLEDMRKTGSSSSPSWLQFNKLLNQTHQLLKALNKLQATATAVLSLLPPQDYHQHALQLQRNITTSPTCLMRRPLPPPGRMFLAAVSPFSAQKA